MAATAPFALFRRPPSSSSHSHAAVETRAGTGGAVGVSAAGDWSGPMLPVEVRRFFSRHFFGGGGDSAGRMSCRFMYPSRVLMLFWVRVLVGEPGVEGASGAKSGAAWAKLCTIYSLDTME